MLGLDEDMVISLEIPEVVFFGQLISANTGQYRPISANIGQYWPPNDRIESTGKDVSITSLQYTNVLGHVDHKLFWVVSRPGPQISTS